LWKFFFALKRSNLFYFSKVEKALLLNYFLNMTGSIFHGWHAVVWRRMKCFWEHFRHLARSLVCSQNDRWSLQIKEWTFRFASQKFWAIGSFNVIESSTGLTFFFFWIWLANHAWESHLLSKWLVVYFV